MTTELDHLIAQRYPALSAFLKDSPGVGDVHVASTGGKKPRPRAGDDDGAKDDVDFTQLVVDPSKKPKPPKGDVDKSFDIYKVDAEQQLVFGWASVSQVGDEVVVDKQGDIIPVDEMEKAVHDFVLNSRAQGDMHERTGVGRLVGSWMFTPEWEKMGVVAKNKDGKSIYGWLVGFKVDDDDLWKAIKRGERPEFSIGGRGTRIPS